jgi:hypothetical protein
MYLRSVGAFMRIKKIHKDAQIVVEPGKGRDVETTCHGNVDMANSVLILVWYQNANHKCLRS